MSTDSRESYQLFCFMQGKIIKFEVFGIERKETLLYVIKSANFFQQLKNLSKNGEVMNNTIALSW